VFRYEFVCYKYNATLWRMSLVVNLFVKINESLSISPSAMFYELAETKNLELKT